MPALRESGEMDRPACVYIIDDDAALRAALDSLFRSMGLATRLFETASSFLKAPPDDDAPACVVCDVRMPGVNGLDFQDQVQASGLDLPVILMTGHGDIPMSVRGMKAGAVDFLPKPFRAQDMLDAVTEALRRDEIRREESGRMDALTSRFESLSPREREVLEGVVRGLMNKQVAGDLGLSEITVKIHRGAAMRKMGARSLADLVRMATQLGLATGAG